MFQIFGYDELNDEGGGVFPSLVYQTGVYRNLCFPAIPRSSEVGEADSGRSALEAAMPVAELYSST